MLTQISDKLAVFFLQRDLIKASHQRIIAYGLTLMISTILNIMLIVFLGFFLNRLSDALVFLVVFIVLRQFSGGYHASTYLKCCIVLCSSFGAVLLFRQIFSRQMEMMLVALVLSLVTFLMFAPIGDINKPIRPEKQRVAKIKCLVVLFCIFGLAIILYAQKSILCLSVSGTAFMTAILILVKKIRSREEVK